MDVDGETTQQEEDGEEEVDEEENDEDDEKEGRIAGHMMTAFEPGQFFVIDTSDDSQLHEVRATPHRYRDPVTPLPSQVPRRTDPFNRRRARRCYPTCSSGPRMPHATWRACRPQRSHTSSTSRPRCPTAIPT